MATSLATYRALVPTHSSIADDTVETYLALGAKRHTATAFGVLYTEAMCFWAAHVIERTPGLGSVDANTSGPVTSRRAGRQAESYGGFTFDGGSLSDQELMTTTYGQRYLDIRNSRAATAPRVVRVGT